MNTENAYWNRDIFFTLTGGGQTLLLRENPIGWNEAFIKWERSDRYYGLFRSYAQDLTFVKEGAYFLRNLFYSGYGRVGADCTVTVEKLDRTTMVKDLIFTGEVDFMSFNDSQDGINVTIIDNGLSKWIKLNENTEYNIDLDSQFDYTYLGNPKKIDYEPYYSLLLTLLDKVTEDRMITEFGYEPGILSTVAENRGITTGRGIRLPLNGTNTVKVKLSDLLKDISILFKVGFYTKIVGGLDTFFVASLDDIYNYTTEIYNLGSVSDFSLTVRESNMFKRISVGYDTQTLDGQTAINEINSESIFVNVRDNANETLDLKCKYRADVTAFNVILSDTTNESLDNDIWHVCLYEDGGSLQLKPGGLQKTGGGISYTVYNYEISPAHLLILNGKLIDSGLDGLPATHMTLEAWGNENNLNETWDIDDPADILKENYDYIVSKDKLFQPYIFTFKAPAGYEFFQALASNPLGYISFEWDRTTYKGFLLSGSVSIAEDTIITFTLLSHPTNNLKPLIRR